MWPDTLVLVYYGQCAFWLPNPPSGHVIEYTVLMNQLHDLYRNLELSEQLALENYNARNGVIDYHLDGVCNHHFATFDANGQMSGEVVLSCRVAKTVNGNLRYTWRINGERVAKRNIDHEFIRLGAFRVQ